MTTLYPIFYGTRMVTFDVLRNTFAPHMHPEAARRGFNFILHKGGKFGIGSGYRPPGTQPTASGFAPPGQSFHEGQQFPSGLYYAAWDMVVVNPGNVHRAPYWSEVPRQGTQEAIDFGWHMNVGAPGQAGSEPWHAQPIELDGWGTWYNSGRPDLRANYPIKVYTAVTPTPPPPTTQPSTKGITVQFNSRELAEGHRGNDVKFYQRQLNDIAGQALLLDGYFGPKTTTAVVNWQTFFKLPITRKLDAATQKSIIEMSLVAG